MSDAHLPTKELNTTAERARELAKTAVNHAYQNANGHSKTFRVNQLWEISGMLNAYADSLERAPHEPQGVLELVKQKRDEYRSFLDNGKGTWPGSDYIQDETWARWQGAWSVLDSIVSQAERERPCLFDKLVGNPLDGFPSTKGETP